jgi:hypothetical protein
MKVTQKFIKKPIIVDAYQIQSEQKIETLEGTLTASPGDWIIKGINGEIYPCKHDIFLKTYEPFNKYNIKHFLLRLLLRQR